MKDIYKRMAKHVVMIDYRTHHLRRTGKGRVRRRWRSGRRVIRRRSIIAS